MSHAAAAAGDPPAAAPGRTRNLAEYGVCVFLVMAGMWSWSTLRLSNTTAGGSLGPEAGTGFVGSLLILLAGAAGSRAGTW